VKRTTPAVCAACLLLAVVAVPSGCGKKTPPAEMPKETPRIVEGNNAFALELYAKLRGAEGNLFLSPYSISTALAMTYAGARGDTAKEMAAVLHLPLPQETLHQAMGGLQRFLQADPAGHGYELHVANALWARRDKPIRQEFIDLVRSSYGGAMERLDFHGDAAGAAETINDWVERQTREKIKDLVNEESVRGQALILTNAIYFKGQWASKFEESATRGAPFKLGAGGEVTVPMMNQTGEFRHMRGEGLAMIEMPYRSGDVSMLVLLPGKVDGLAGLEDKLSAEALAAWIGRLGKVEVRVSVPKFRMTRKCKLGKKLRAMGMVSAFKGSANFSGITPGELWISEVLHKAFVDVNEEGTEAAAATAVIMSDECASEPLSFIADHPFIFIIRDSRSGSILFMGRVVNPKA